MKGHKYALKALRAYLEEMGVGRGGRRDAGNASGLPGHLKERVNWKGEPINAFSQNHLLKSVKCLFRFLTEESYLLSDPARGLRYAKVPKILAPFHPDHAEMRKLLEAPDTRTALGYRDRTILELMYSTGLRKKEVNQLKVGDVDTVDGFARVNHGKWNKDRMVPLGKIACRYVENYVKAVRPMLLREGPGPTLFVRDRAGVSLFALSAVWEMVTRHARAAGLEKRVTPHTLRHTCATLMMRNKANIRHIQVLLGHDSLEIDAGLHGGGGRGLEGDAPEIPSEGKQDRANGPERGIA